MCCDLLDLKIWAVQRKNVHWIILAEYLSLFALLAYGYILEKALIVGELPAGIATAKKVF